VVPGHRDRPAAGAHFIQRFCDICNANFTTFARPPVDAAHRAKARLSRPVVQARDPHMTEGIDHAADWQPTTVGKDRLVGRQANEVTALPSPLAADRRADAVPVLVVDEPPLGVLVVLDLEDVTPTPLVPGTPDDVPGLHRVAGRKRLRVRRIQPPTYRISGPPPHEPEDAYHERLPVARRVVDDEVPDLAVADGFEVLADAAEVPVVLEGDGLDDGPRLLDELVQVAFGQGGLNYLPLPLRRPLRSVRDAPAPCRVPHPSSPAPPHATGRCRGNPCGPP
jgi:hypothetical protein